MLDNEDVMHHNVLFGIRTKNKRRLVNNAGNMIHSTTT